MQHGYVSCLSILCNFCMTYFQLPDEVPKIPDLSYFIITGRDFCTDYMLENLNIFAGNLKHPKMHFGAQNFQRRFNVDVILKLK